MRGGRRLGNHRPLKGYVGRVAAAVGVGEAAVRVAVAYRGDRSTAAVGADGCSTAAASERAASISTRCKTMVPPNPTDSRRTPAKEAGGDGVLHAPPIAEIVIPEDRAAARRNSRQRRPEQSGATLVAEDHARRPTQSWMIDHRVFRGVADAFDHPHRDGLIYREQHQLCARGRLAPDLHGRNIDVSLPSRVPTRPMMPGCRRAV
jgi:hypothetical protein